MRILSFICFFQLSIVGLNPQNQGITLQRCEGDCDTNADCEGDLKCFERKTNDPNPPGCSGTPHKNYDYCYDG